MTRMFGIAKILAMVSCGGYAEYNKRGLRFFLPSNGKSRDTAVSQPADRLHILPSSNAALTLEKGATVAKHQAIFARLLVVVP